MLRALAFATSVAAAWSLATSQVAESVLHIRVFVVDCGQPRPVPRHSILISDDPPSRPPRRIETGNDGTANVRLRAGSYIVESDAPFVFEGMAYEWTQSIDVAEGRDAVLELTAANAEVRAAAPGSAPSVASAETDASSLLAEWQDSVFALWTPTSHASGFLIDANGLIASNQRAVGSATTVEVQISETVKVTGQVVTANPDKDVAVIRINAALAAALRPVPLPCAEVPMPAAARDREAVTIGVPLLEAKGAFRYTRLPVGSSGGPAFNAAGTVVGLTSFADEEDRRRRRDARVVPLQDMCSVADAARAKVKDAPAPGGGARPHHLERRHAGEERRRQAAHR